MRAEAGADTLAALLHLERRARQARTPEELAFVVANDTFQLAPYRQAAVFAPDALGRMSIATISGLATLAEDSPYTVWLQRVFDALWREPPENARRVRAADLPADLGADWAEWMPEEAVLAPLPDGEGRPGAAVLYATEPPWSDATLAWLAPLHEAYGYGYAALTRARPTLASRWRAFAAKRSRIYWAAAIAIAAVLFPVRITALGPAEIIGRDATAVAAPMDGVVQSFHVAPNQAVKRDQPIFSLDDTTLRNRLEIARKSLAVARADALAAAQKSFDSAQSKSELAAFQGRVAEREAEAAFLEESLLRVDVRAPRDGVALYGDPNDWIGKPVQTGERIAMVADPADVGVLVWMPVADAVNLEPGAPIRVFLSVAPLAPLDATLELTSYQPVPAPDGIAAYRIRGKLDAPAPEARIGLRGTAKVYGPRVPLAYYVLRRPLAAARQWFGI